MMDIPSGNSNRVARLKSGKGFGKVLRKSAHVLTRTVGSSLIFSRFVSRHYADVGKSTTTVIIPPTTT
jgi:hypothetical protein